MKGEYTFAYWRNGGMQWKASGFALGALAILI